MVAAAALTDYRFSSESDLKRILKGILKARQLLPVRGGHGLSWVWSNEQRRSLDTTWPRHIPSAPALLISYPATAYI